MDVGGFQRRRGIGRQYLELVLRILGAVLVIVVGCSRTEVVIEPEEIDVCPVIADQLENHLASIVEFAEEATIDELTSSGGMAGELRQRGVELSERAIALGCDAAELRSQISPGRFETDDPVARQFVDLVLEALP